MGRSQPRAIWPSDRVHLLLDDRWFRIPVSAAFLGRDVFHTNRRATIFRWIDLHRRGPTQRRLIDLVTNLLEILHLCLRPTWFDKQHFVSFGREAWRCHRIFQAAPFGEEANQY